MITLCHHCYDVSGWTIIRTKMKYVLPLYFIFVVTSSSFTYSQNKSQSVPIIALGLERLKMPPLGIGHFLEKDYAAGAGFAAAEALALYLGRVPNLRPDTLAYPNVSDSSVVFARGVRGFSPEACRQYTIQRYMPSVKMGLTSMDLFLNYQSFRKKEIHTIPLTDRSLLDLAVSPWQWKYQREPEVFIPLLFCTGVALLDDQKHPSILEAKAMNWMGLDLSPSGATLGRTLTEGVAITFVAVGEELLFRGLIQTELSEAVNPNFGLVASSLLFGLYHMQNNGLPYALRATAGGFYLGWQYKKSNYDLGRVIAIHFNVDFSMSVIEFLKNPIEGRGVYSIQVR